MSAEAKLTFGKIKPFCIEVSRQRNVTSIQKLQNELKNLSCGVVQELHEYVLFPLRMVFLQKANVKEDAILSAGSCMTCVFLKSQIQEWKTFQDLYHILILQISKAEGDQIVATGSEDKKLSILNALLALLNTSLVKHWESFYHASYIPYIGHLISTCLSVISCETSKSLRKVAISIIECLCWPSPDCKCSLTNEFDFQKFEVTVGNCMTAFLPGILSALVQVVSGDVKEGHAVKCKALDTVTVLLKLTVGDDQLKLANDPKFKDVPLKMEIDPRLLSMLKQRDDAWVENIASKMNAVIQYLSPASDHSYVGVRFSLLNFCHEMLQHCYKNAFRRNIGSLLKITCKLLHDNIAEVVTKSTQVIDDFSITCASDAYVKDILYEELFCLCDQLPRIVSSTSDNSTLSNLKTILGFLEVLKDNLHVFFYSSAHVNNLLKSVVQCFHMDCSNLHRIEEVIPKSSSYDDEIKSFFRGQANNWLFKKSFKYFHDEDICHILIQLCRFIGRRGELDITMDYLKKCYEKEIHCRAAVLVMSEVLLGARDRTDCGIFCRVDDLIDIYTTSENWYLCTSYDSFYAVTHHIRREVNYGNALVAVRPTDSAVTLKTINANIILACLHLEAIGTFSGVLGINFRKMLVKALYPILEIVNDSNHLISSCAVKALETISISCQYQNIAELISENADYLVSTISIQLRHLSLFPRTPAVLQAMLNHCDAQVFPLVRDTIDEILSTLDANRRESRFFIAFLPVLLAIVKAVNAWFTKEDAINEKEQQKSISFANEDDICSEIVDSIVDSQQRFEQMSRAIEEPPVVDDESHPFSVNRERSFPEDTESGPFVEDEKKEIPRHISVVEQILLRCAHLISNENVRVRVMIIDIVNEGVKCLAAEEDVLLPIVHKLWDPLAIRCKDPELQVVSSAFKVICNLGIHSGTFMRRRFTKDVLPKLLLFLKDNAKPNVLAKSVTHSHTTLFKLQLVLLKNLGSLLLNATVGYKDIDSVCHACVQYLSAHHPLALQKAAVSLYEQLIKLDTDALWLFLSDRCSSKSTFMPDNANFGLQPISVAGTTVIENELFANVMYLLSLC